MKQLKVLHPDVTQPWYAENAVELSKYDNIELYFNLLKHAGPSHVYYPEPPQSVLIV